jgi:predicted TIM-barrel fold metal-dependent hydrolase
MATVVDFHVHVLPEKYVVAPLRTQELRRKARAVVRPLAVQLHRAQGFMRHLPLPARNVLDQLTALAPIPSLLFESTAEDLEEAMNDAGVHYAVVIAHPPATTNEYVVELAKNNPRLIAAVNIPPGTDDAPGKLREYIAGGAKILKIHPASDGLGPDSDHYLALLEVAQELKLPVILHTGCLHSHLIYKDPEQGHAARFEPWYKKFNDVRFILAHMNFHEPAVALDLAEEYPNLWVDTSWQPAEVIGEAVRRIGSERVLFGTDWPIVGHNMEVAMNRVRECLSAGTVTYEDADRILGLNALQLLGIESGGKGNASPS